MKDQGTVIATAVEVMEHGLLSGSGTIVVDLAVVGAATPGQSPGALEVAGDLDLAATESCRSTSACATRAAATT